MQERYRGVEQLEARRAHNPEVVGSSPASATKKRQSPIRVAVFFSAERDSNNVNTTRTSVAGEGWTEPNPYFLPPWRKEMQTSPASSFHRFLLYASGLFMRKIFLDKDRIL